MLDRPQHVWVVAADGSSQPRDLTPGPHEFANPAWAPDSSRLVVDGAAHDTWDLDLGHDLFTVGLDGEAPVDLTGGETHDVMAVLGSWSPDGSQIAFLGFDEPLLMDPQNARVGVLDVASGERRWVSVLDRTWAPYPGAIAPIWDDDGLLAIVEDRGNVHLRRVPVADARRGRRDALARR